MKITTKNFPVYLIISMLALSLLSQSSYTDETNPVTMSPHKIILNAKGFLTNGISQDIQAVIGGTMPDGYSIVKAESEVTLQFTNSDGFSSDEFLAEDLRYCYIDNNYLATFNRQEIQESLQDSLKDEDLASLTVTATIGGYCIVTKPDEDEDKDKIQINFNGSDSVEIIDPDKK